MGRRQCFSDHGDRSLAGDGRGGASEHGIVDIDIDIVVVVVTTITEAIAGRERHPRQEDHLPGGRLHATTEPESVKRRRTILHRDGSMAAQLRLVAGRHDGNVAERCPEPGR